MNGHTEIEGMFDSRYRLCLTDREHKNAATMKASPIVTILLTSANLNFRYY
jgi:hypothetical protein